MTDTPIERHVEAAMQKLFSKYAFIGRVTKSDLRLACQFGVEQALATIEPIPSAGEGERVKALEEAAHVAENTCAPIQILFGKTDVASSMLATRTAIAAAIRDLATLPSEPLRDD